MQPALYLLACAFVVHIRFRRQLRDGGCSDVCKHSDVIDL